MYSILLNKLLEISFLYKIDKNLFIEKNISKNYFSY